VTPFVVLFVSLAAFAVGVFTGWFARERMERPPSADPESELRALREVHSGCAARIRGLHLELAQLETRISMSRLETPSRPVNATVSEDELEGAARLASLIDVLESGSDSDADQDAEVEADETDQPAAFMSILPADIVESHAVTESDQAERVDEAPAEPLIEPAAEPVGAPGVALAPVEAGIGDRQPVDDDTAKVVVTLGDDETVRVELTESDDLTLIKGIGPKIESILHEHGITTFRQIADLDEAQIEQLADALGSFRGRIHRDDWVGAARQMISEPVGR
jgi:predicted flap endonuclease-1-like 5' DNA nuclease